MSFLVYLFVLLVAAGSVIFGLDWTQAPLNPPPYATPAAQTATANPAPAQRALPATKTAAPAARETLANAGATSVHDEATQAQASAADATTASVPAAAHCDIAVCSAAYRSFRASDCTYQPFDGERRFCSKSGVTGKIAAAIHAPHSVRHSEPRDERRLTDRRDYDGDRRGSFGFDYFFGGNAYDER